MIEKFKPCPFCGSEKTKLKVTFYDAYKRNPRGCIVCTNCGSEGAVGKNREEAALHWNTRMQVENELILAEQRGLEAQINKTVAFFDDKLARIAESCEAHKKRIGCYVTKSGTDYEMEMWKFEKHYLHALYKISDNLLRKLCNEDSVKLRSLLRNYPTQINK